MAVHHEKKEKKKYISTLLRLSWSRVMISAPIEWSDRKALSQPNLPQVISFAPTKKSWRTQLAELQSEQDAFS